MLKRLCAAVLLASMLVLSFASCKNGKQNEIKGPVFNLTDEEIKTFENPMKIEKAWVEGVGDPFVMRYDGVYYLYPSTGGKQPFVACWSSKDLVNWKYEGNVASHKDLNHAYAPEVTYFNGKFYMYTATPDGKEHRCLVSDSPTGPFKFVGEGQARRIDGHIFIDNDGKWYFYAALGTGVQCYPMQSPEWIGNPSMGSMAQIASSWTEGPMVVYHDGYYYFTYTGNHGGNIAYRIYCSYSNTKPYTYSAAKSDLVLVNTSGASVTTGHSSTVKAPDLDGYYAVYHSYLARDTVRQRHISIDRIIFDGESMRVMGPTVASQTYSSMPDIYSHFDNGDSDIFEKLDAKIVDGKLVVDGGKKLISKNSLSGSKYTIEATLYGIEKDGKAGVIFGYRDEKNYGKALLDTKNEKLTVTFVVDGKETVKETKLVRSFDIPYDFDALQSIQVEKSGKTFTFYVNDRELCKFDSELSGNKVGIVTEKGSASFGFFGASDEVNGSSNCDFYKTVSSKSGDFPAHLATEDDTLSIGKDKDGSKFVNAKADDSLNYRIYVSDGGNHSLGIKYKSEKDAKVEVYLDGKLFTEMTLKASKNYTTEAISGLNAEKGKHVVTLYIKEGSPVLKSLDIVKVSDTVNLSLDFKKDTKLIHSDGIGWSVSGGQLKGNALGKRTYGSVSYGDYTYEGDITFDSKTINAGLLFRTSNAADNALIDNYDTFEFTTTAESAKAGENWMQGYYLQFTAREVMLKKCDYDLKQLVSISHKTSVNECVKFKIVCEGANIKVYINEELLIDYTDDNPYLSGAVGMRITNGSAVYDNIKVIGK